MEEERAGEVELSGAYISIEEFSHNRTCTTREICLQEDLGERLQMSMTLTLRSWHTTLRL